MIAYWVDVASGRESEPTIWIHMDGPATSTKAKATLYSKDSCSFCIRAKMLLEQNGVDYEHIDLTGDFESQVQLAQRTGRMTMPLVFVGDELIGGFEDLVLALRNPRIREALNVV
jgi:glutaredoxin 3